MSVLHIDELVRLRADFERLRRSAEYLVEKIESDRATASRLQEPLATMRVALDMAKRSAVT